MIHASKEEVREVLRDFVKDTGIIIENPTWEEVFDIDEPCYNSPEEMQSYIIVDKDFFNWLIKRKS